MPEKKPPEHQNGENERDNQSQNKPTEAQNVSAIHVDRSHSPTSDHKINAEDKIVQRNANEDKHLFWTKFEAISTVILNLLTLVVIGLGAWIAYRQMDITAGQLREMRDSSGLTMMQVEAAFKQTQNTENLANAALEQVKELKATVEVFDRQASTAREANTIARQNMINADRPWVGNLRSTIVDVESGKTPKLTTIIENFGKTPALEVESWGVFGLTRPTIATSELANFIKTLPRKYIGTIFPSQRLSQDFTLTGAIPENGIENILNGTLELSKLVLLRYKDRWGGTHHTWMYDFYDPKLKSIARLRREGTPPR